MISRSQDGDISYYLYYDGLSVRTLTYEKGKISDRYTFDVFGNETEKTGNTDRDSVDETLNALLDHEADELINAEKYERSNGRQGYRSGHYDRNFTTTSGDVTLYVPKLKGIRFETAIIERYRRRECSVEEALIEMYLASVSVKRVEDITETL